MLLISTAAPFDAYATTCGTGSNITFTDIGGGQCRGYLTAAISYLGTGGWAGSTSNSASLSRASTIASGDLLVMFASVQDSNGLSTIATPSGWTAITDIVSTAAYFGGYVHLYAFYKVAGGSESSAIPYLPLQAQALPSMAWTASSAPIPARRHRFQSLTPMPPTEPGLSGLGLQLQLSARLSFPASGTSEPLQVLLKAFQRLSPSHCQMSIRAPAPVTTTTTAQNPIIQAVPCLLPPLDRKHTVAGTASARTKVPQLGSRSCR